MKLNHDLGQSLEARVPHLEKPLWRYVYGGKPKPFFHPLTTPAGHVLTIFEPWDHIWHRGLWFTIKFINEDNFWEEKPGQPFGTQVTTSPLSITPQSNDSFAVASRQQWIRPDGQAILDEIRAFNHVTLDETSYALDFTFSLTPRIDVKLDRTPFTTWGGYGGLCFRGNRNWQQTKLLFDDNSTSDRPTPKQSKWCDLTGKIDGAYETQCGVAIFDHPNNPRHPVGWYGGTGTGHYFNAAFLFQEPMLLKAGELLKLRYRVLVHDGARTCEELESGYQSWISAKTGV